MRLPRSVADQLAERVLIKLCESGILNNHSVPWKEFHEYRQKVRGSFHVPETTLTPLMARILYGISYHKQPRKILGIGTYAGNALAWLAGPGLKESSPLQLALGVDISEEAVRLANRNFERLGVGEKVKNIHGDGHDDWGKYGPFDIVFLDADDPVKRKSIYLSLLDRLYPWIIEGGLLLAHDICVSKFQYDMKRYKKEVSDKNRFSMTLTLEVDDCGLEVSMVKNTNKEVIR